MAVIFPDRIIAVRGTIENMSKAEAAISALLRECMEKDMQFAVQLTLLVCRNTGTLISTIICYRTWTFAICYLPSICLSSVTFVRPTQAVQIFGNISTAFGTLAIHWRPLKILRRSSQGNPSTGGS